MRDEQLQQRNINARAIPEPSEASTDATASGVADAKENSSEDDEHGRRFSSTSPKAISHKILGVNEGNKRRTSTYMLPKRPNTLVEPRVKDGPFC